MWEEDPRYQHASLRLAVFELGLVTLGFAAWSAWKQDWIYLGAWLLVLAVILMALLGYGAVVWLVCHSVAFVSRLICRKRRRVSAED
jgi:hypothetical protein